MSRSPAWVNSVYTCATKPGTTMVFTLVPVMSRPWTTSGAAKRRVTRRPRGTAMQRGTNMNCVAMTRTVTPPSAPTVVPRFCSANSPDRCSVLGSMSSTLLGGVYVSGERSEHDHAERGGNEHADAERPQQFGAENASLVSFNRLLGHGLADTTPRQEDEEIDRQIADHQQGHGEPGHDTGTERHDAHDLRERGFIDLIGYVRRGVVGGRLISGSHRRAPTSCAPANLCKTQFYTEAIKRPATSRTSTTASVRRNAPLLTGLARRGRAPLSD